MKRVYRLAVTLVLTTAVMAALCGGVYYAFAKPRFYKQFIQLGEKYLSEGSYSQAILEFDKALAIQPKSTEALLGQAAGFVGFGDVDKASEKIRLALNLEPKNEELLEKSIELIKDLDPQTAYDILLKYIETVGEENISDRIRQMYTSSTEPPVNPRVTPDSGIYAKPFNVQFIFDKERIGHVTYYTLNGDVPTQKSQRYKAPIPVNESTRITLGSFSPSGAKTNPVSYEYDINTEPFEKLKNITDNTQREVNETNVGTEPGNCVEGAKDQILPILNECKRILEKEFLTAAECEDAYMKLNNALYEFRQMIIVPTDKENLQYNIGLAHELLDGAVEGDEIGNYREGSIQKLMPILNDAIVTNENILARQDVIDARTQALEDAIDTFAGSVVTELDRIFIDAGANIGEVTVSLLWNTTDDVDLYVTSPLGDTVSYYNTYSSSGGRLDIDRQVDTFVDNPVENVYWSNPPSGTYSVSIDIYTKRSSGAVPITVRVLINGKSTLYQVNVTNTPVQVCTFTY